MTTPSNKHYQSLKSIVNSKSNALSQLRSQAQDLQQLQQHLAKFLPDPIAKHCRITQWQQGKLTIGVDNAACITQLRYHSSSLRDGLRSIPEFAKLTNIEFKVVPQLSVPIATSKSNPTTTQVKRQLSLQTTTLLQDSANKLQDDPKMVALYAALTKLAQR